MGVALVLSDQGSVRSSGRDLAVVPMLVGKIASARLLTSGYEQVGYFYCQRDKSTDPLER